MNKFSWDASNIPPRLTEVIYRLESSMGKDKVLGVLIWCINEKYHIHTHIYI